ncbi:hypothetical protein N3C_1109 [Clostridium sp. N3C]|nr:hypothetical protein N3C_1109 [Clostridium sp. N3C]
MYVVNYAVNHKNVNRMNFNNSTYTKMTLALSLESKP